MKVRERSGSDIIIDVGLGVDPPELNYKSSTMTNKSIMRISGNWAWLSNIILTSSSLPIQDFYSESHLSQSL